MGMTGFTKPTLTEIQDRIYADISAKMPELDPILKATVMNVMADTFTGLFYSMYGYVDWASDQSNVLFALAENLDNFGTIWSIQRKSATIATGTITFTGTDTSVIPAGTIVQTQDETQYTVLSDATISGGTVTAIVESLSTGVNNNQNVGTIVSMTSPITGVDSDATVVSLINGSYLEEDEVYRSRLLSRIDFAPHGGTKNDYVVWALENANVTRAWTYPLENGDGTVVVRFMMDDTYSNGIPLTADITSVQNDIDTKKPVTANLTVVAPTPVALPITITNLSPNTAATQASIQAELKDMILRKSQPGQKIFLSWIYEAISTATGESSHAVTSPTSDITHLVSEIATLGTISYV